MNKFAMKLAVLAMVLIILIGAVIFFYLKSKHEPTAVRVKIDTVGQPTLGNPNAPINIVAFEDLKCVNCMRFETTLFPQIKEKYIDTGKAKYTLILLAFIPGSPAASNAAHCVYAQNHDAFFEYVDYIFNHQPPENEDWTTIPTLMEFASHIKKIDQNKLSQCLVENTYNYKILANLKVALKVMPNQIATPAVYINGIQVNPLSMEQIDRLIKNAH